MKKYTKKLMIILSFTLLAFTMVACKKKGDFTVTFNSNGGSKVAEQKVKDGDKVKLPKNPTNGDYAFDKWDLDGFEFDFNTPVKSDIELVARWKDKVGFKVNFNDHWNGKTHEWNSKDNTIDNLTPVREGFKFGGWYSTKRGHNWLDTTPTEFPLKLDNGATLDLYAYWEPINSVDVNWSKDETYSSTITKQAQMILNPLVYRNSLEDSLISNMATSLYATEVDWGKAIEEGVASHAGDFSKIESGEFDIKALTYKYVLQGARAYPTDIDGDDYLTEDGEYDYQAASSITSTEWTFYLRDDIRFQDGTKVTSKTYEYTLQQYLSKEQNNYRANIMYKTEENTNGLPLKNAYEYFAQKRMKLDENGDPVRDEPEKEGQKGKIVYEDATVAWEEVGFDIIDDYTFKLTFHEPYTQARAISFGSTRLLHPEKYAASLNENHQSNYGTPRNPYVSYGPYVLKSWDENQKLTFNKNYDFVAKETINYKSTVYTIVDSIEQQINLFRENSIDVIGLNAVTYQEFSERENFYTEFSGYPVFLSINTAPSKAKNNKHVPDTILFDADFRKALLFGFDRVNFNENYSIPDLPSLIPVPGDIKNYLQDPNDFVNSTQYLKLLEELGIDPDTYGFDRDRAVTLFDGAYARWIAQGNTGAASIKLIATDSPVDKVILPRIKAMLEGMFEQNGVKRLIVNVHNLEKTKYDQTTEDWDFDILFGGIGFGGSLGSFWQMGAISFFGGLLGGADLGLSQPYTTQVDENGNIVLDKDGNAIRIEASYVDQVIEIDLTTTYNYLVSLGGAQHLTDQRLFNTLELFNWLEEEKDAKGVVVKPAGIYKGTVYDIGVLYFMGETPWNATNSEPFTGASEDANNIAAAMLEVFYEHVTHIPTGSSRTATLYQERVVIEWPEYSESFGWGSNRYRYLSTDKDFQ